MDKKQITPAFRITKGRIKLLFDQPFFGSLIIPMQMTEDATIPTMCTDGKSIKFSPKFVDEIANDELLGVLCHEVLHCANNHHLRRGKRDPRLWNIACDYAINPIVIEAGMKLPKGALLSDDFKNMSAEKIYSLLVKEQEGEQPKGKGHGKPGKGGSGANAPEGHIPEGDEWDMGGVEEKLGPDGKPLSKSEGEAEERENSVRVAQAAQAAHERGKLPGSLKRMVADINKPVVDWRDELRRMFGSTIPADYTWARGNRRHLASGLYLPSSIREGVGEIVVGIDTSGSIQGALLDAFFAEIKAIFEDASPDRIHLVWCDAKVKKVQTFERGEELTPEAVGGGGTDFRPVFDWVAEQGIEPQALIYLTDMYGVFPKEAPDYPVIWAKTTTVSAPFGDEIEVQV